MRKSEKYFWIGFSSGVSFGFIIGIIFTMIKMVW